MAEMAASPSPEAGQPVDEQTTAQGGAGDGGVDDGAPGEVAPQPKRQRKERLPGVVTRNDGEGIFEEMGYKSRTGKRISRKEAQQEAEDELREEAGLEPRQRKEEPPAPKVEEAPAPKKIKFAGEEYDDLGAAEQKFKSLQGMFKPLNERVSKAEALAREAAENARYWREQAEARQSPTPPSQVPPSSAVPQTSKSAEQELQAALANVDGEMFETLARERGLPLAGRYLAAQVLASVHDTMLPALRDEILAQINPRLEPVAQSVEFQQQTQQVSTLIDGVSQLRNPDGNLAFPELNDENEMYEIAELWSSMDNPQPTPQSLIQAIALYRLYRGARGGSQTPTPQVQVTPPESTMPRPQPLEAGGGGARPTAPRAGSASEDARFARELDNADLVDRTLGFAVRRRR
jgi:hypothetical protein